jgi:hypothetical protein
MRAAASELPAQDAIVADSFRRGTTLVLSLNPGEKAGLQNELFESIY